MHKEAHIIAGNATEDYKSFNSRVSALCERILDQIKPQTLKVSLTTKPPPGLSIIPFKKKKIALISMTTEDHPDMSLVTDSEGCVGSYELKEALPVSYSKTWKDGEATPGVCLLTLFHKKAGLDEQTFKHRWFEGHTPLSLKLHPLWNYNRNEVKRTLTEHSTWYDGIVEEQFRKGSDLLNPFVFFGPAHKVPLHMAQVWMDTRSFIDMKRIETYLATEIHLKS